MAWRCVVKNCITKHCNAENGVAQRPRTQRRTTWHGAGFLGGCHEWILFERSGPAQSRASMSSSLGSSKSSTQRGADGVHPLAL
eukprot:8080733-Pyramimonas_sp.AAC.1